MFRAICTLLLAVTAASSSAQERNQPVSVEIQGRTYSTGYLQRGTPETGRVFFAPSMRALPDAYDARGDGVVSAIKDQGNCGSCWAFARTKAMEAAVVKAGMSPLDLSEQDTLVNDKTAYGCGGGFMDGAFETKYGQTDEAHCPYKTSDRVACNAAKVVKANKWAMVGASGRAPSVDELKAAIYQYGVLAVTVAAGGDFSPDSEGRITRCSSRSINHMVTLAGWRPAPTGGGVEFLIGNSWGKGWGKDGFAWSKQGCNKLASTAGDAALFFYVEGQGPDPQPAKLELPQQVVITKGHETALQVRTNPAFTYKWSDGTSGSLLWVRPSVETSYTLTATAADGSVTSQAVKVTPK